MTDKVDNLVLEHLRAIRADVGAIKDDVREIKHRLASLEGAVAGLKRDQASSYADTADQHLRYDRLADRLERVERRLDLRDGDNA
jgi:tetrahydromethanopterin S-methyltransferase subunit G